VIAGLGIHCENEMLFPAKTINAISVNIFLMSGVIL
jgi:hypothetical protein